MARGRHARAVLARSSRARVPAPPARAGNGPAMNHTNGSSVHATRARGLLLRAYAGQTEGSLMRAASPSSPCGGAPDSEMHSGRAIQPEMQSRTPGGAVCHARRSAKQKAPPPPRAQPRAHTRAHLYRARSPTPATLTTLNRTPGISPFEWPRRPNPATRTSSCGAPHHITLPRPHTTRRGEPHSDARAASGAPKQVTSRAPSACVHKHHGAQATQAAHRAHTPHITQPCQRKFRSPQSTHKQPAQPRRNHGIPSHARAPAARAQTTRRTLADPHARSRR